MERVLTRLTKLAAFIAVMVAVPAKGWGHEFWIEPRASMLKLGDRLTADLKVGTNFQGEAFPFLHKRFTRFSLAARSRRYSLGGEDGDAPAINLPKAKLGLNVIAYQSTPDRVTYADWQLFINYADQEGLSDLLRAHAARGLPKTGFVELYTRYAKTLVQVGPVSREDQDVTIGMPLELIAGSNPYAGDGAISVQLLWQQKPMANTQVTVFRDDGQVAKTRQITDAQGIISVSPSGGGRFLLNAVHIEPAAEPGVAWQSHWASLTFEVPVPLSGD